MKKILTFVILALVGNLFAEDVISKKTGKKIHCIVIEVAPTQVTYYQESDVQYPIFKLPKSDIVSITFENGKKILITNKNINKSIPVPKRNIDKINHIKDSIAKTPKIVIPHKTITKKPEKKPTKIAKKSPNPINKAVEKGAEKKIVKTPVRKGRYTIFLGAGRCNTLFETSDGTDYISHVNELNSIGVNRDFPLTSFLSLKLGVFLNNRRGSYYKTTTSTTTIYGYDFLEVQTQTLDLDLPLLINLGLNLGKSKKIRLYTDFGARLSISPFPHYDISSMTSNNTSHSNEEMKTINYGLIIAVGAEFNKFIVEAKVDGDLSNRYKIINDKCSFETELLMLGYKF